MVNTHVGRKAGGVLALALSGALALAACGSSSPKATGSSSSGAGGGAVPSATLSAAAVKTLVAYTGGTAGKATGSPVTIGLINSQGGADAFPEFTTAAESAAEVLNNQLGGIAGHPLQFKTCFIASADEQGQTCAQEFLADPSVVGILQLSIDNGVQQFHATLAGKIPVLGINPTDISDASAKNAYYIEGGQFSSLAIATYVLKYAHVKSVSLVSAAGIPPAVQAAAALKGALEAAGVKVTQATYSPTATDFVTPLEASGAESSGAVLPLVVTPSQCIAVAKAAQQIGLKTPVISLASCLGSNVKSALGDYPKWDYLDFTVNADAPTNDPTTAAQVEAYKEYVAPIVSQIPDPGAAIQSLQGLLTLVKAAGQSVPTRTSLGAGMAALTGPVFLGAPTLKFGVIPTLGTIGSTAARFYAYGGNGSWTDLTQDQWVTGPAFGGPPSGTSGGAPSGAPSGASG